MTNKNRPLFNEETTGKLMKKEFIAIEQSLEIDQAIEHLREEVKNKRNIHYIYVIDEEKRLIGTLSLRELLAAEGDSLVSTYMETDVVYFPTDLDQEPAATVFRDTDLVTIPVVNRNEQLIGVVHVDEIIDVIQEETTEDFHKMAPVGSMDEGLGDANAFTLYRKRIGWLVLLVFINIFSGAGIAHFEDVIASNIALVFFLPLLVDSGGNAGSQSATLMIRAMAVGDIKMKDWLKMFLKEISVSVALGLTMALAVATVGVFRGGIKIAIVVAITMTVIVVVGSLIGMSMPFIFNKLKLDPATASAPLITSIADIVGVLIYFSIASKLLTL
ncbi:MAG TPA: magnesium transporter [Bacillota bacterium]